MRSISTWLPITKYTIHGNSMLPNLHEGDAVLVNRLSYLLHEPKTNNIVALKDPRDGKTLIKRIVKIDSAKQNAKYFVLGDNPKESTDSRSFGWITKKDIIGKVVHKGKA
jgi:nickel-type superoxide dismutase maturation protease